LNYVPF